jgi:segregation and condensation protein A
VREGQLELNQKEAFAPIYFRKGRPKPVPDAAPAPDAPVA